jgi:hypothetical protein
MRSITRLPRLDSLRRPDAVIEPSGKASVAATLSRRGVSGLISSRCGNLADNFVHSSRGVRQSRVREATEPHFAWVSRASEGKKRSKNIALTRDFSNLPHRLRRRLVDALVQSASNNRGDPIRATCQKNCLYASIISRNCCGGSLRTKSYHLSRRANALLIAVNTCAPVIFGLIIRRAIQMNFVDGCFVSTS